MKKIIDLGKEKVKNCCLNWTALDVACQVESWESMAKDIYLPIGQDYDIIDEHTEEQREYMQGIMQDVIEDNDDRITEIINDRLWDYMNKNKREIIERLINNKYIKRQYDRKD